MQELLAAYRPQTEEPRWQKRWRDAGAFTVDTTQAKKPFYVLEMFPYPSGDLHMGHVRNYTLGDVFARFARMQGLDVLHPMGWDALGLPAENQAIAEQVAPQTRTPQNIARMRSQMEALGLGYDWDREIATYRPEYYRWNQWFFIKLRELGLVKRRESKVNFCVQCDTVLANEQVLEDGSCWRGHPEVLERVIPEWSFAITELADELLTGLDTLTAWPERVTGQQRHWIGRSDGARVAFALQNKPGELPIDVFTTRVDTVFGVTYLVMAPDHPRARSLVVPEQLAAFDTFAARVTGEGKIARTSAGSEKHGLFTGQYVLHPLSQKPLPLWVANFVLADYGCGAVMAVPAHDTRDYAFARKYELPIVEAIVSNDFVADSSVSLPMTSDGIVTAPGTAFDKMPSALARTRIAEFLERQKRGEKTVSWHLRDWGFSRQRYWGTPIPIVYCEVHGAVSVREADLPVILPDFSQISLTGRGGAPLSHLADFVAAPCPTCGKAGRREVDTMDTFVDSAWYFARFLSPHLKEHAVDSECARTWLPVDIYVGGPEHAVMHLLYFRFFMRAMRKLGLVAVDEPVRRLITQGMVNAPAWRCPQHGYQRVPEGALEAACRICQGPLQMAVEKMSKSKYNGVDPMAIIERFGADAARLYALFAAPPEKDLEWSRTGVEGVSRFLGRVARMSGVQKARADAAQIDASATPERDPAAEHRALQLTHRTLRRLDEEMRGRNHFNTAIASLMELTNRFYELKLCEQSSSVGVATAQKVLRYFAQMLSPFAPHLAETVWDQALGAGLCAQSAWPAFDPAFLEEDAWTVAVQVGGKMRGQITVAKGCDQKSAEHAARAADNIAKYLSDKEIIKIIWVPGRMLNFVVRPR